MKLDKKISLPGHSGIGLALRLTLQVVEGFQECVFELKQEVKRERSASSVSVLESQRSCWAVPVLSLWSAKTSLEKTEAKLSRLVA